MGGSALRIGIWVQIMIAGGILSIGVPRAAATTVTPFGLAELSDHAAAVFTGTVTAVRSYWRDDPREIESEIEFTDLEFLSDSVGVTAGAFQLTAPGGKVGTVEMRVAGAPDFHPGQRWVLFVLPEYRTFPIVGIWEGAFRVVSDSQGVERIHDSIGVPIVGLDEAGRPQSAMSEAPASERLVQANHVILRATDAAQNTVGMSYEAFIAALRPYLQAAKRQSQPTPVGVRVAVQHRPVSLRSADPEGPGLVQPSAQPARCTTQCPADHSVVPRP